LLDHFLKRAESRMLDGDIDGAISDLRKALEVDPEYDTARYNLAGLLSGVGRTEESLSEYEKIDVSDTITWIDVKFNEIEVLKNTRDYDACSALTDQWLATVEQLLKDCPADDEGFLIVNERERLNLDYVASRYGQVLSIHAGIS
jgi:tetratricopeptide (TPR) repeat protein